MNWMATDYISWNLVTTPHAPRGRVWTDSWRSSVCVNLPSKASWTLACKCRTQWHTSGPRCFANPVCFNYALLWFFLFIATRECTISNYSSLWCRPNKDFDQRKVRFVANSMVVVFALSRWARSSSSQFRLIISRRQTTEETHQIPGWNQYSQHSRKRGNYRMPSILWWSSI